MQRYIEQLIEDIHRATLKLRPPNDLWTESEADPDNELELEDMSYVEKYIYGSEEPISKITGIESLLLPQPDKLTMEQQATLAMELENLLLFFHFKLDFPENYPAHLRYPFICNFWNKEQVAMSFGENHIEFCSYDEEKCPFPGYCNTCKEIAEQMKYDEEQSKDVDFNFDIDANDLLPTPKEVEDWMKQQGVIIKNEEVENIPSSFFSDEDDYIEDINGFYNDDGTKVDPASVPIPGLCVICRKYQVDDWDENLLCLMNRNDQKNDTDFKCGAFEKI